MQHSLQKRRGKQNIPRCPFGSRWIPRPLPEMPSPMALHDTCLHPGCEGRAWGEEVLCSCREVGFWGLAKKGLRTQCSDLKRVRMLSFLQLPHLNFRKLSRHSMGRTHRTIATVVPVPPSPPCVQLTTNVLAGSTSAEGTCMLGFRVQVSLSRVGGPRLKVAKQCVVTAQ